MILEEYGLLSESEFDAICESEADAESLLSGYVKRAYFEYRNARFALTLTTERAALQTADIARRLMRGRRAASESASA